MVIQNGIGEGELTRGCFITTYMFKIDDVGTTLIMTTMAMMRPIHMFGWIR